MIDLRRFSMPSACFCTKSSSNWPRSAYSFVFERTNRPRFASLQFRLSVFPYLFNGTQVWRVGGPFSVMFGFDVIWVFFQVICSSLVLKMGTHRPVQMSSFDRS